MSGKFKINGSPTADGYYTTYSPDEVTVDQDTDTSALIVNEIGMALDKTIQELYEATKAGRPVYLRYSYGDWSRGFSKFSVAYMFSVFQYSEACYRVGFIRQGSSVSRGQEGYLPAPAVAWYGANTPDAYPTYLTDAAFTLQ